MQGYGSDFLRRRYHNLLAYYVLTPDIFVPMMKRLNILISGHTAVQWLLGIPVGRCALELYVYSLRLTPLVDFLRDRGYYRGQSTQALGGPFGTGATAVNGLESAIHFIKVFTVKGALTVREVTVRVVEERVEITRPIAFQPTTASMTYITATHFSTLFPDLTFDYNALVALHSGAPVAHVGITAMVEPTNIPPPIGHAIHLLDQDGFCVRWPTVSRSFDVNEPPCGFACPELWKGAWKGTFAMSFHSPNIDVPDGLKRVDAQMAEFTAFLLGGRCKHRDCPRRAPL